MLRGLPSIVLYSQGTRTVSEADKPCRESCIAPHCGRVCAYIVEEPHDHHRCLFHKCCLNLIVNANPEDEIYRLSDDGMVGTDIPVDVESTKDMEASIAEA